MDNPILPKVTASSLLDIVRTLRADAVRHEQLLEQVLAFLQQSDPQQSDPPVHGTWSPPCDESAIDFNRNLHKVRHVEGGQVQSQDILVRLKATGIGKFYVKHAKRYSILRRLTFWVWRNGYPVYVNHVHTFIRRRGTKRWRKMTSLIEFVKTRGIRTIRVAEAAQVETSVPKVFPSSDQGYVALLRKDHIFPSIYVATVSDGVVFGGTNLTLAQEEVICHDLYDFKHDYTSEELHGRNLIDAAKGRIRLLIHDDSPEHLPAAATFVDACASNYAHWLTEVLPRIALFCADAKFQGIPIIVNDGLHKNIMESLFLVAGPEREIITLPIGRGLRVDELYLTSVSGYIPFEPRTKNKTEDRHGLFSAHAFDVVRSALDRYHIPPNGDFYPQKIYTRRNSGARNITNLGEVEGLLHNHGYAIVETEKLSFLEQMNLFANAKIIVGPSGAAFANSIFVKKGTKIGIIVSKHEEMPYGYWPNILTTQCDDLSYIMGDVKENAGNGIHADFHVSIAAMNDFLEDCEK